MILKLLSKSQEGEEYRLIPHGRLYIDLAVALMVLAGIISVWMVQKTADADRLVTRTFEIRQDATKLLSDIQDAETGQRGFLLTNDESYLGPFFHAQTSTPATLARLRSLAANDATELKVLDALKPLVAAKLSELEETVALDWKGERERSLAIVKTNNGRVLMERIRTVLDAFSQEELTRLTRQQEALAALRGWTLAIVGISLIGAIALAAILARETLDVIHSLRLRTAELEAESGLRREAEESLRQAQRIEAIGQLAGGIAHDFNNLLTIVLGNLDTMQRRIAGASAEPSGLVSALAKPVELALRGARSAAQLTQRLLAFSRRQALEPEQLDLNDLVSGMSDLLRRSLGEEISIETILAGGLWQIFADANQMESALLHQCPRCDVGQRPTDNRNREYVPR